MKAFTLVEMLVSVVILGIMAFFVSTTITQTKKNFSAVKKDINSKLKTDRISQILYEDIIKSSQLTSTNSKKYTILYLKTKNSIYDIKEPFVIWYVSKEKKSLIRIESSKRITIPLKQEDIPYTLSDKVTENCENFLVYKSKDLKYALAFIDIKKQKPVIFEAKIFNHL